MSLVTIATSTYNSSAFILETLESFLSQSYQNVELIIGDDASSDDTLEKVREWLAKDHNRARFSRVSILEVPFNTGVSANANRKLQVASGDWIKFIGSDDTLHPDCISDNMKYIDRNPDTKVLFSKVKIFKDTFEGKNFLLTTPDEITQNSILSPERTAESQHRMLLNSDKIHFSPSAFMHRETLLSIGGFDERFRLLEDYPLWLNLTKNGHKLHFMDKITVNYRRHSKAINNTGIDHVVNPNYFKQEKFRRLYIYPNLPADIMLNQYFFWYASQIFRIKIVNKNNGFNRFLLSLLTVYINPFRYVIWIRKQFNNDLKDNEFYA